MEGAIPEDQQLIGPVELAQLLGRSKKSIQVDASRRPETLPPRFIVPGTRLHRWRVRDVIAWMDATAKSEVDRRKREADFFKRFPARGRSR